MWIREIAQHFNREGNKIWNYLVVRQRERYAEEFVEEEMAKGEEGGVSVVR